MDEFWFKLKSYRNILDEAEFEKLSDFVLDILLYPHSSVACEKTYSKINLTKTTQRKFKFSFKLIF